MIYTSPKHVYTEEWGSATELSLIDEPPPFERFRQFQPHGTIFQVGYVVANVMDQRNPKYNLMRQWKNFASGSSAGCSYWRMWGITCPNQATC